MTAMRAFRGSLRVTPDATPPPSEQRHYWLVMQYGCRSCGFEMDFYLEHGCEGPRDRSFKARLPKDHPFSPGKEIDVPMTNDGRGVVPVPFVAGSCADCGEDDMTHIRWNEDRLLDPPATHVPEDAGAFFYPADPTDFDACGRPVYPKARSAGRRPSDAQDGGT